MLLDIEFRARIWLHEPTGSWHFVTLPQEVSAQIHAQAAGKSKAWGTLPVVARIGSTRWKTSIFRDRKRNSYLLPLKSAVRAKEQLRAGDEVEVSILAEMGGDP